MHLVDKNLLQRVNIEWKTERYSMFVFKRGTRLQVSSGE